MNNKNFLRTKNKIVAGVCGGIARLLQVDSVWVRLIYALLTLITGIFIGILVYVVLWLTVPEEKAN